MIHGENHGRVWAHRECGEARGYAVDVDPPQTSPASFDTGQDYVTASGSRVGGADRAATPLGALEAGVGASDDGPGAEVAGPHPGALVDPDDTTRCPVALWCARCQTGEDLIVATADSALGIHCLTLCESCADAGRLPRRPALFLLRAVADHAGHLGCTVDDLDPANRPVR
ncbi:hypothetical protein ACQP04_09865 [Pseudonocardia halophobica]|uniref:hypothetical protein n=1 Tax=Pseudonocardia halophobica TaxID=29401 RepID=UPI003D8F4B32